VALAQPAPFDLAKDFYENRLVPLRRRNSSGSNAEMYSLFTYSDDHNLTDAQMVELAKTLADKYSEQSLYKSLVSARGAGASIDSIVESLDPQHKASPANRQWMKKCLTAFQRQTWDKKMKRAVDSDAYRKGLEELADKLGKPREELVAAWKRGVS